MSLLNKLQAAGINGVVASKFPSGTKTVDALAKAKKSVLANLALNKGHFVNGIENKVVWQAACFKKVGNTYSIGLRHGHCFVQNVYEPGASHLEVEGKEKVIPVLDALAKAVTEAELDTQLQASVIANKRAPKAVAKVIR